MTISRAAGARLAALASSAAPAGAQLGEAGRDTILVTGENISTAVDDRTLRPCQESIFDPVERHVRLGGLRARFWERRR